MDWNNDGDFTDDGELAAIDEVNCSSNKYLDEANCTKTISVPEGIAAGTYRMRVVFYEPVLPTGMKHCLRLARSITVLLTTLM